MLRLVTPDLLLIDDLGLRPLRHDEPIDLYEVIRQRYERGARRPDHHFESVGG